MLFQANYGMKDIEIYTFGQPRLGNAAFATFYTATVPRTIRVTHQHDLVVHLPPYYPLLGQKTYHHFPNEVFDYLIHLFVLATIVIP